MERTERSNYHYNLNLEDVEGNRTVTVTFSPVTLLLYLFCSLLFSLLDVEISARELILAQILNG